MALNYEATLNYPFPDLECHYTERDSILYALGLGIGVDPEDNEALRFVYEGHERFSTMPTQVVAIGMRSNWATDPSTGVTYSKMVHAGQRIEMHRTLPTSGTVICSQRIVSVVDKGVNRGALVLNERKLAEKSTGENIATITSTTLARADGGFGKQSDELPNPARLPDREPDNVLEISTQTNQALIYRLSGDWNPLHADPAVASAAGFRAPILHGLCSYGLSAFGILKTYCGLDGSKLISHEARFSSPVFPGDTVRIDSWQDGNTIAFRALANDRVVLNNGRIVVSD
ncbi:MaoC family dehydratase [Hoeflea poritis]|uniref:MaoC/PaaZ C-terminal domain-containing protein n=1 Tax=Hoeflea poritis TaxID=2993659 RepID=A0ABT4VV84_9HYPH|nr:MaoC family dehydratase [Hoeflea poritis]MDA4848544.1 MaoC/PaaZ C-terminal domain-containing protein [Hoeflea poritis]